jgi:photosystem II stability/assembly factor-like uncharacterized protein
MTTSARRFCLFVCLLSSATLAADPPRLTYDNLPPAVREAPRPLRKAKFGPPPPGYHKIVGGAVPGWQPSDMHRPGPRGASWFSLGPRPITSEYWSGNANASGRIVSIAAHPTLSGTAYAASASGGVWKTTNGGTNWTPMTDELSCLNHGCVAVDPSNPETVYAGTGEYTTGSLGDGLFRSLDGGVNWSRIATVAEVGTDCSRVLVDPTNSQIVHVTGSFGYMRSTDGGANWTRIRVTDTSDLAIHPTDGQTLYLGSYGDGIYRSTNGGTSWTQLTSGLPTTNVRRILLSISRSTPTTLYAAIINGSSGLRGMYKTTNGGNTWTQLTATPNFPSPQGWYDCFVGVDPANANIVYGGGVFPDYAVAGVIKTTNGGTSWTDITRGPTGGQLHPDQHCIAFGPTGTIWVGNDGGVWTSTNGGSSWTNRNAALAVTQNYNIALHPTDANQLLGGTQDNGTVGRETNVLSWPQVIAGDGGFAAFDFANPSRMYTTYVYLTVYRITSTSTDEISGPWDSDPADFIAPLVIDPNNARALLGGTNRIWRTTNADTSATWTAISTSSVSGGGTIRAIAVAPGASNTIYSGSSTGRVYVTTNASTWNDRSPGGSASISDIVIDPTDPGTAYISIETSGGSRVLRTANFGMAWTNVTGELPSGVAAQALACDWRFDPPDLYVGTGVGVYESHDGGLTWVKDGTDLPNVNIGDLAIDPLHQTVTAGTYGRGAWRKDLRSDTPCPGDLDGNRIVELNDLSVLLAHYGTLSGATPGDGDMDGDGDVDLDDLSALLSVFGTVCP